MNYTSDFDNASRGTQRGAILTLSDFLSVFFPDQDEPVHLRFFKPRGVPETRENRPLNETVTRHALAENKTLQNRLKEYNQTRGCYFVVNTGGNSDAAITRFNAFFCERDQSSLEEQHKLLDAAPLLPSIRVETKKSVHAYWLVSGQCSVEQWRDLQQRLIQHFGADEKLKNPSRVMRLPYFDHVSADGSRKRVVIHTYEPERRYCVEEMQKAFSHLIKQEEGRSVQRHTPGTFATWDALRAELGRRIYTHPTAKSNSSGRVDCRGICHNGKGDSGLFYDPATNQAHCNKGCEQFVILRAFNLPEQPGNSHQQKKSDDLTKRNDAPLRVVRMADVMPEEVEWLWNPRIPIGKLTILEGEEGIGKTFLLLALASGVTHGRLPDVPSFEPGSVLLMSAEDGIADTLRPRLDSVGAEVSRIFAVGEPLTLDASGLLRLEAAVIEYQPKLVTIDPLFAFTGGKVDIHRANECRAIFAPLAALAEKHRCAIVALRHIGKSKGDGDARRAGIGSIDLRAAARSVLLIGTDPDNPGKRAIVQTKNNLAPLAEPLGYDIREGKFYWTGKSDLTSGRILSSLSSEETRSGLKEAQDFLNDLLTTSSLSAKEIQRNARDAGISEATLRRAKDALGIRSRKIGQPGKNQEWHWELPDEVAHSASEAAQLSASEHLRSNSSDKSNYGNGFPEDAYLSISEHLRTDWKVQGEADYV